MRYTEFRDRLTEVLGPRADYWCEHTALTTLGSRTVNEALAAGVGARELWEAVATALDLPPQQR